MSVETPERMVPREITVYEREIQCIAPDCGRWFKPKINTPRPRWCSRLCKLRAFKAGLSFHKDRKPRDE